MAAVHSAVPTYTLVTTPADLAACTVQLSSESVIALDTEASSFHRYRESVCLIQLSTRERTYLVDPLAIQWGTDGAFVWGVRGGIANRIPVRIVQRNTDSVLVDGTFDSGDSVVTEGIHNVREGSEVFIAGGGAPRKPAQSEAENRRTSSGS